MDGVKVGREQESRACAIGKCATDVLVTSRCLPIKKCDLN